jgi:hypothetical protein
MMQMYKTAVKEEEETTESHKEVLECWELLVKKGGNTDRYHVTFIEEECSDEVKNIIADFEELK